MNETACDRSPESLENEIIALTRRLKRLRPALSPSMDGLTPMEVHALVLLFCADEQQLSVKPSDIARRLRVSASAVSQLLKSLERKGFIVRARAEGDLRSVRIGLTEKGQSLSAQLRRERSKQFMDMVEIVGIDNMNQLVVTRRTSAITLRHQIGSFPFPMSAVFPKGGFHAHIIGYLKQSKVAVALIVVLLIVQAFADLSLPRYTSDLVDVGIQQGGIEDCSPSVMSSDTFNYACMLASDADEQLLRSSYERDSDGNYALTEQGSEQREDLNSVIALPLVVVHFSDQMVDSLRGQQKKGHRHSMASRRISICLSCMPHIRQESSARPRLARRCLRPKSIRVRFDESLIQQQAIMATKAEYEQLGIDMGAMQMSYLIWLGARMLGIAALMMVASIAVGFIASRTAAKTARGLRERLFENVIPLRTPRFSLFLRLLSLRAALTISSKSRW